MAKLKIYSDRKWLPENCRHVVMLYPFWGDIPLPDTDPDKGRFDEYIQQGKAIFEMVNSVSECDIAVLPFEYSPDKKEIIKEAALFAEKNSKKLIVFFNSDSTEAIDIKNTIIFRTSFFRSKQQVNERAFPGWSIDFMKKYNGNMQPLKKSSKAKISYCGYVDTLQEPGLKGKIRAIFSRVDKESESYGSVIRGKAVRALLADKTIETDLVIRDGFWAQGITDKIKVREEYMQNMFNSPYALVTRGAGNFSYRLIEVMSCGRIPVFIHTDSVLPMEKKINWKKQTVWVEEDQVSEIGKVVSCFHNSVSENDLTELQKQNRNIYETYLSPTGFFSNLNEIL